MSCGYHVNLDDGLITVSCDSAVAMSQAQALAQELLADPDFDPRLPQLVDLRGIQLAQDRDAASAMRDFMLSTYRERVQSSIAIVINESLDANLLADLYHMSCAMDKTEVFDQYDQALKWLMRREFA